ncbi:MAG: hypothetical protein LBV50_05495 [Novosphingobium sp.]|nr:hypothetical protein [Novosphingobium sp.]
MHGEGHAHITHGLGQRHVRQLPSATRWEQEIAVLAPERRHCLQKRDTWRPLRAFIPTAAIDHFDHLIPALEKL